MIIIQMWTCTYNLPEAHFFASVQSFRPNIERIDIGICLKNTKDNSCTQDKVTAKTVIEILLLTGASLNWTLALGFLFGFGAVSAKVC